VIPPRDFQCCFLGRLFGCGISSAVAQDIFLWPFRTEAIGGEGFVHDPLPPPTLLSSNTSLPKALRQQLEADVHGAKGVGGRPLVR
jgi:hypothetical protein